MEDFCIDLYYYFDKSSNRKGALKEYAQFCDREYRQIRYVNVRWLSLEKVADWALMQYDSLKSYFLNEDVAKWKTSETESDFSGTKRFKCLQKQFKGPLTQVCLYFYDNIVTIFNHNDLKFWSKDIRTDKQVYARHSPVTHVNNAVSVCKGTSTILKKVGDVSFKHFFQLCYKSCSKYFGQDCSVATWGSLYLYNRPRTKQVHGMFRWKFF